MSFTDPWKSVTGHLQERDQQRENSARLAVSNGFISVSGSGEHLEQDVVPFGCVFAEKPSVAFGYSLDGDTLWDGQFPRITGGVFGWDIDQKGRYLGAYIMVCVDIPAGAQTDLIYEVDLYFTFTGVAIKDIPDYLLDE